MKAKRPAPVRGGDERRRGSRQPERRAQRRTSEAQPRSRRSTREQRPLRSAPQTNPIPRPTGRPAQPKNASQAKARAKARKAKAPKVVRPPLRERLILKLASIDLNPRTLAARVPFVVLIIGALGMGLGITLWLSTDAAERSYQLGNAREANQALLQQKEALERDVLEAQAAPALAEAARNLGMIPSRDTAHLVQDPAGNWIVVGTPKPAGRCSAAAAEHRAARRNRPAATISGRGPARASCRRPARGDGARAARRRAVRADRHAADGDARAGGSASSAWRARSAARARAGRTGRTGCRRACRSAGRIPCA